VQASGGLRRGRGGRGAELAAVAARLLFGLPAQPAGQIPELVQGGIDADIGELGLGDLQVEVPDVAEDAAQRLKDDDLNCQVSSVCPSAVGGRARPDPAYRRLGLDKSSYCDDML
jgi:hypothetical protein